MCVGSLTSWIRLISNSVSHRTELRWFEPESVSQSMSGQLKSPFIKSRVLRGRELKACSTSSMYDSGLDGGMHRQQISALSS